MRPRRPTKRPAADEVTPAAVPTPRRRVEAPIAIRWSACYAPHSSMYLDQFGTVRACCQASGAAMGHVSEQSLREIWDSASTQAIRDALEQDDYSQGCDFCRWQLAEGNERILYARTYDDLAPAERRPTWPRQLELALSNACNLQCVMCNGNWSSAIRANREGRPPLTSPYGEAFFEQLAEFLPHLDEVELLGGEPFLGPEPLRVMEMLAELPNPPRVTITTNATIWTPRVERLLERLRPRIVVSLDGAADSYERVRVGARFDEVLANLDRFLAAVGPDHLSVAHCLMVPNWHEFDAVLGLAEERDLFLAVNVVRFPAEQSLYHLDPDRLRPIVATLSATDVQLSGPRRAAWDDQRHALAAHLATLEAAEASGEPTGPQGGMGGGVGALDFATDDGLGPPQLSRWSWLPFPEDGRDAPRYPPLAPATTAELEVGTDGVLHVRHQGPDAPFDGRPLAGRPFEDLLGALSAAHGAPTRWRGAPRRGVAGRHRFVLRLDPIGDGAPAWLDVRAVHDGSGALIGASFAVTATDPTT